MVLLIKEPVINSGASKLLFWALNGGNAIEKGHLSQ